MDIPQEGQEGLTIRNVECLFLKKKMITTNSKIRNYDLYNENNVYIIPERNGREGLTQFLANKPKDPSETVLKKYDFINWVESFA